MDVSPRPTSVRFPILCIQLKDSLTTLSSFAADYDSSEAIGVPVSKVMDFVRSKLVCGRTDNNIHVILACLSVRFALDFGLSDAHARDQYNQVEEHLRLCLGASRGFSRIVTRALSEPYLAKAAAGLVKKPAKDFVDNWHMPVGFFDYGQRGELVASLLVMQARDMARKMVNDMAWDMSLKSTVGDVAQTRDERWKNLDHEWVHVREFIKALLPPAEYNTFISTPPAIHLPHDQKVVLETTFNDSKIWFNHVIKVDRGEKIHVGYLWKFVSRGAMIICPPGYHGIDIVLPVCFKGNTLARDNMTAILIQVKNDKRYRKDVSGDLFDHMDPFDIGLFSDGDEPLPVIRMVFALGSDECGITFPSQEKCGLGGRFTSYDIWCAGLSPSTFACIGEDLSSYQALLERSIQASNAAKIVDNPR